MKKIILTTIVTLSFLLCVNAQNSAIILGVNGGANFSSFSLTGDLLTQDETTSSKLGFQGGIDLGVKFNSFSFITGFKYVQNGGNTELEKSDPNDPHFLDDGTADIGLRNTTTRFKNISIPLLFRYQTKGDLSFAVSLGPVLNSGIGEIKTEETYTLTISGELGPEETISTFGDLGDDLLRSSWVGFMVSPGVIYKVGDNGFFRANVTYHSGGNIVNENLIVGDSVGLRNVSGSLNSRSIAFEIGYEHRIDFNIGSKY